METFSRSQLQQELNLRCYKLAANNNRGFKQEFGVTKSEGKRTLELNLWSVSCQVFLSPSFCRSCTMLAKSSLPEQECWSPTKKKTDILAFCHVSSVLLLLYLQYRRPEHAVTFKTLYFSICDCRWSLQGEVIYSKPRPTLRLHQCKFCACKYISLFFFLMLCFISFSLSILLNTFSIYLCGFRVEDQNETSSAPRVLCLTPSPTFGGWCGSKMSG